jgi:hypothetical protein
MLLKSFLPYIIVGVLMVSILSAISLSVKIDNSPPTVEIKSPTSSGNYITNQNTITLGGSAGDDIGVARLQWFNVDTGDAGNLTGVSSWADWTVADIPLEEGTNDISVRVYDAYGNQHIASIRVVQDKTAPLCTILEPKINRGVLYLSNTSVISMNGKAFDNQGVVSVAWKNLNNNASGTTTGTYTWNVSGIPLAANNNTIKVTVTDSAGNIGSASIIVNDDIAPPVCTITTPTTDSRYDTNVATIDLSGTAADNRGVTSVFWKNTKTGTSGSAVGLNSWTISGIALVAGYNLITVNCTDAVGNEAFDSINVSYDATAPTCQITYPSVSTTNLTKSSGTKINGTCNDNNQVVRVNWTNVATGESADAYVIWATHNWTTMGNVNLTSGSNLIKVTAWDAQGNSAQDTITITRDSTNPVIAITNPSQVKIYTNVATIDLDGTVSDNNAVRSITWENNAGGSGSATVSASWSMIGIGLSVGWNNITVMASDFAGNNGTDSILVNYNAVSPVCTITVPTAASSYITKGHNIKLNGTCTNNDKVVSVDWTNSATGISDTASLDSTAGTWASIGNIHLAAGNNLITVTAWDRNGNSGTDTITVTNDSVKPTCTIVSPTSPSNTALTTASLSGTASDNVAINTVTWHNTNTGGSGTATGTTAWSVTSVALKYGGNKIVITVTDTAGNSNSANVTVTSDSNKPLVAITSPTSNPSYITNGVSMNLGGTSSDNLTGVASVTWTNNNGTDGSGTATGTTSWTITGMSLVSGTNWVTVTALDVVGNSKSDVIKVISDPTAPTCQITVPTTANNWATTWGSIKLNGSCSDNRGVVRVNWTNVATGISKEAYLKSTKINWTTSSNIVLANGNNHIIVRAWDSAGNSGQDFIDVMCDNTKPTISVVSPISPNMTALTTVDISGTASDNILVSSVTWHNTNTGGSGTATGTTAWSMTGVVLAYGSNNIVITAHDGLGNQKSATITVTSDSNKPLIQITSPTTNPVNTTSGATIDLGGTASDSGTGVASVTWSNNVTGESGTATGTTTWSITGISLNIGDNWITVTATDMVGNTNTDVIKVIRV